jgi:hypothetical protein
MADRKKENNKKKIFFFSRLPELQSDWADIPETTGTVGRVRTARSVGPHPDLGM